MKNLYQQIQITKQSLNQFGNFKYGSAVFDPAKFLMKYGFVAVNHEQENMQMPFNLIMDGQNTNQTVIKLCG